MINKAKQDLEEEKIIEEAPSEDEEDEDVMKEVS